MFSILIPTYKNINYLKICIDSLLKNSKFNNQIIVHVNGNDYSTKKFLIKKKILFTNSINNIGMSKSLNNASIFAKKKYIVISHDDFYYCPNWDFFLLKEIKILKSDLFLYTGLMIGPDEPVKCNFGNNFRNFNERKLLKEYKKIKFYNFVGPTKHPAVITKNNWKKVNGWSEDFYPTGGDDTDFLLKLWKIGIREFKGVNLSRVYHFGSITTRKRKDSKNNYLGSKANKIFIKKWGVSINFFEKFYLQSGYHKKKVIMKEYNGFLNEPKKNFNFFLNLFICKLQKFYILFLLNFFNRY